MSCHAPFRQWTRRCCYLVGLALLTATLNLGLNAFMETGRNEHRTLYIYTRESLADGNRGQEEVFSHAASANVDKSVSSVMDTVLTVGPVQSTASTPFELVATEGSSRTVNHDSDVYCTTSEQKSKPWIHLRQHRTLDNVNIRFSFKTTQKTALIAYEMDTRHNRGDYLAIALYNTAVVFTFDPGGGGRTVLRSRRARYNDGQWHDVLVTLNRGRAQLTVDNAHDEVSLKGQATSVNSNSGLFFFAAPRQVRLALDKFHKQSTLLPPFSGCLRTIVMNTHTVNMTALQSTVPRIPTNQIASRHISSPRTKRTTGNVKREATQISSNHPPQSLVTVSNAKQPGTTRPENYFSNISIITINGLTFKELRNSLQAQTSDPSHVSMERAPILTAFSQNHFQEAIDLIGSVQLYMPKKRVLVYDLGLNLHARNQLKTFCRVELRTFDFSRYPQHFRWLKACAWKPVLIKEVLEEFGAVVYCDASTRFQRDIFQLHALVHQTGIVARQTLGPISAYTHPATLRAFGQKPEDFHHVKMAAAGVLLIEKKLFIVQRIIKPWVECAHRLDCIAPAGLRYPPCMRGQHTYTYRCHRFDQSILNVLLYLFLGNSRLSPALTTQLQNVTKSVRHATHQFKINTC